MKVMVEVEVEEIAKQILQQFAESGDVVQVVRCKDCVHWEEQRRRKYNGNQYDESICDHLSDTFGTWDVFTAEDFFCADGERRSEPEEGGTDDVPKTD